MSNFMLWSHMHKNTIVFLKPCLAIEPRPAFNSCSSSLYIPEIWGWSTVQGTAQYCWLAWGSKLRSRRCLLFNLTWNCSKFSFLQLVHSSISGKCPQGRCGSLAEFTPQEFRLSLQVSSALSLPFQFFNGFRFFWMCMTVVLKRMISLMKSR